MGTHLVIIAILAAPGVLWELSRIPEPNYRGKALTAWVQQYNRCGPNAAMMAVPGWTGGAGWTNRAQWVEASHALDVSTNAIPFALQLAATHDSMLKRFLLKIPVPVRVLNKLACKDAYLRWTAALTAERLYVCAASHVACPHTGSSRMPPVNRVKILY